MSDVRNSVARSPWRWPLALVIVGAAVAWGLRSGKGPIGVEVTVAALMVAIVAHLIIHEGGHLLAALLTGLPVTRVRISLRSHSMVVVRLRPSSAALAVRTVVFALGGPLANLGCAALTYQLASESMPVLARYALVVATVTGLATGLLNLLPFRLPSGLRSDGSNVLRWTLNPGKARAELERRQRVAARVRTVHAIVGGRVDGARIDEIVAASDDPLVLLAAFERRPRVDTDEDRARIVAEAERLSAIAHDERTDPNHASLIAGRLATLFGMQYLYVAIVDGAPVSRADTDEIIDIGELAFRLRPDDIHARIGLAIVRLLDHRPLETRGLLVGAHSITSAYPRTGALMMQIRAVAEVYLGDQQQADRLIAAAGDDSPAIHAILAALKASAATGQLPPLSQRPATA
ncbi:hypothetical protein [Dactylosporangium sp. CA-233914]|uniref:hypothetical protein n=1 Tax=Dactylosporangium sp. CA-233914 TaxID=3239934 RepID=UPI003D8AE020